MSKLKKLSLLGVGVAVIGAGLWLTRTEPQPVDPPVSSVAPLKLPTTDPVALATNRERSNLGLTTLTSEARLNKSALDKCNDMQRRGYFAHTSSSGENFRSFMPVGRFAYGENLAQDTGTAEETVRAWMNSPTHRENIVNPIYTYIGVGYCSGSQGILTVQHFSS